MFGHERPAAALLADLSHDFPLVFETAFVIFTFTCLGLQEI